MKDPFPNTEMHQQVREKKYINLFQHDCRAGKTNGQPYLQKTKTYPARNASSHVMSATCSRDLVPPSGGTRRPEVLPLTKMAGTSPRPAGSYVDWTGRGCEATNPFINSDRG